MACTSASIGLRKFAQALVSMSPRVASFARSAPPGADSEITEARLLGAILLVSEVIILHGARYAPLLDRLEHELEECRRLQREDPIARARAHLARARPEAAFPVRS